MLMDLDSPEHRKRCTGSLITHKWIVSAAHCFCEWQHVKWVNSQSCTKRNHKIKPKYDVEKHIRVVIGLKDITEFREFEERVLYNISKLVIHPKYNTKYNNGADLSLLRLDRSTQMTNSHKTSLIRIEPICLPLGKKFPDSRGKAYVA